MSGNTEGVSRAGQSIQLDSLTATTTTTKRKSCLLFWRLREILSRGLRFSTEEEEAP